MPTYNPYWQLRGSDPSSSSPLATSSLVRPAYSLSVSESILHNSRLTKERTSPLGVQVCDFTIASVLLQNLTLASVKREFSDECQHKAGQPNKLPPSLDYHPRGRNIYPSDGCTFFARACFVENRSVSSMLMKGPAEENPRLI